MVVHTWQPETRWPQKTKFPLMKLPLELRQIIYYQVFQSPVDEECLSKVRHWNLDDPLAAHLCANQQSERNKLKKPKEIRKSKTSKKGHQKKSAATPNRISLLFVSKQVGAEAAEVLYNDCLFHVGIDRKSINLGMKTTRFPLHRLTELSAMLRLCNWKLSIYTVCHARSDKDREFPALARNLTIICNGLAANATQLKDLTIELPCFCGSIKLEPSLLDYLFNLVRTVGEIPMEEVAEMLRPLHKLRAWRNIHVECHCWSVPKWNPFLKALVSTIKDAGPVETCVGSQKLDV